ncbi:MAG TPA: c-type cytochrome [Rhodocyclaceae bacterium]
MRRFLLLLSLLLVAGVARAQHSLSVTGPSGAQSFTAAELSASPQVTDVTITHDPVFNRAMNYRAVPTAMLLQKAGIGPDGYVQARAVDDFSVAIPARVLLSPAAFLAVEDPAKPWPKLSKGGRREGIGPFYLVYRDGQRPSSEYWVYRLAALKLTDSPIKRWPQLAVAADLATDAPARRGLERFVEVCFACHRFRGAGEGTQGPDLGTPMNPVAYFQPAALKKLLRDPESVRSWPERKMPAFTPEMLSDSDIDAIIAWLTYKEGTR